MEAQSDTLWPVQMSDCVQQLASLLLHSPCRLLHPTANIDDAQLLRRMIRLCTEDFYEQDERAALLPAVPGLIAAMESASSMHASKSTWHDEAAWHTACAGGPLECALALRSGFSVRGVLCAVHCFSSRAASIVLLFSVAPPSNRKVHELVAQMGASAVLDMHVYRTPVAAAQPQPDSFWGERWHAEDEEPGSSAEHASEYATYRQVIDALIEAAVLEHCTRSINLSSLTVMEICAGDGALAERLIPALDGDGDGVGVARYLLVERNAELSALACRRLACYPAAKACQGDAVDACVYSAYSHGESVAGEDVAEEARLPRFSLCLSAGSVLCSQVGKASEVGHVLSLLSQSLVEGGILIATGVSTSFLHPAVLHSACFSVVRGSHPTELTQCAAAKGGIEHAWGRFQFFVLRKATRSKLNEEKDVLFRALADAD